MEIRLEKVAFRHAGMPSPLLEGLTLHLRAGWTGIVGANGSGKTTLLRLAAGELRPDAGTVRAPARSCVCAQETEAPPAGLEELLASQEAAARRIAGLLGVVPAWAARWDRLSHGERKRAQIACALREGPDALLLDEPTNHVDAATRRAVLAALRGFRGIGVLVSHDRELLDAICAQTLFVEPPRARLWSGGYTRASEARRREQEAEAGRHASALDRLASETALLQARREAVSRIRGRLSSRRIDPKDRDAIARRKRAVLTGRDARPARQARLAARRAADAEERLRAVPRPPAPPPAGVTWGGERPGRNVLARLPEGTVPLGDGRALLHPELEIRPGDRIGLTGPNGSGKTTLLESILTGLDLPFERVVKMPQELDAASRSALLDSLGGRPSALRGRILSAFARLGSDPERLLATPCPSPGEARKLLLAEGIAREPWLLILDEPTNHLDLPSIERLEAALEGCASAMLLASHDERFLTRLARVRWRIEGGRLATG